MRTRQREDKDERTTIREQGGIKWDGR